MGVGFKQHRECKTGGGAYFAFFLGSDNSHTIPPKTPPDKEGLLWGRCVACVPLLKVTRELRCCFPGMGSQSKTRAARKAVRRGCKMSRSDPCSVDFAAKLPNSDFNFAVDLWVDFSSRFFQGKRPKKHQTSLAKFTGKFGQKNSPRISAGAYSLGKVCLGVPEQMCSESVLHRCKMQNKIETRYAPSPNHL